MTLDRRTDDAASDALAQSLKGPPCDQKWLTNWTFSARYCQKPEPWNRSERIRHRGKEPVLKYLRAERQRLSAEAAITILFFVLLSCFFVFGMIWIRQIADGLSDSVYEALTLFSLGLAIFLQLIARVPSLRWVVLGCVIATLFIVMAIAFAS
jgi:hypothetical protein